MMKSRKSMAMILAGAAIGAAVGVLAAPEEGKETRKKIGDGLKSGSDHLMNSMDHIKSMIMGFVSSKATDFESSFSELIDKSDHKKEDIIASLERKLEELKKNDKSIGNTSSSLKK